MNWAVVGATLVALVLVGVYLSWTAGRLDRLHNRTNAAWAALDAQLVRRAAVAAELAHAAADAGRLERGAADALAAAAQRALDVGAQHGGPAMGLGTGQRPERVAAENQLGRALRRTLTDRNGPVLTADDRLVPLVTALEAAMTKVVLARRFHATAVEDTMSLRRSRVVRWFRLAGSAPVPVSFDIDDTPAPLPISTAPAPR